MRPDGNDEEPVERPETLVEPSCELCEAARFTHWYEEDEICWVADCEVCDTPMVVWRHHGTRPSEANVAHMMERLGNAGGQRFGPSGWSIDRTMRQIPSHFHAHARDPRWMARRWESTPSRYNGVGAERKLVGQL